MTTTRQRAALGAAVLTLVWPAVAGCSGDDGADKPAEPTTPSASTPPPVATRTTVGKVAGKLGPAQRRQLATEVTAVVDGWFDAAYVGGDYPRSDFADAFVGFSKGARAQAVGDVALMTNQDIGAEVEAVRATGRRVWVDVLAAGRKPAAVTARFALTFETDGGATTTHRVSGRLFLDRKAGDWQVFGYDVKKGGA